MECTGKGKRGRELQGRARERPLDATKGGPQLMASREMETWILQPPGTEFCQPLHEPQERSAAC